MCEALDRWSQAFKEERNTLIKKRAEVYDTCHEEMAQAMSMEMGAPFGMNQSSQIGAGTWHLQDFLQAFVDLSFENDFAATERTLRELIGVCAMITTWNRSMNQITLMALQVIATGSIAI